MANVESAHYEPCRSSTQSLKFGVIGYVAICLSCFGPAKAHAQEVAGLIAAEQRCISIVESHGFLSRAQFQCGIKDYSEPMFWAAKGCIARLSSQQVDDLLRKGFSTFDDREKRLGREVLCRAAIDRISETRTRQDAERITLDKIDQLLTDNNINYDQQVARQARLMDVAVMETRGCLREAAQAALGNGRRNRGDVLAWTARMCGAKLYYAFKVAGRSPDEARAYLGGLAETELNGVLKFGN